MLERSKRRVALDGVSFKVGRDDLRESPFVRLAEALIGKGVHLRIDDPDIAIGNVFGHNCAYIDEHLPHVAQLFGGSLAEILHHSGTVIVAKRTPGVEDLRSLRRRDQTIVNLVGLSELGGAIRLWAAARTARASV